MSAHLEQEPQPCGGNEDRRRRVSLAGRPVVLIAAVVMVYDLALTSARLLPELVSPLGWAIEPPAPWLARVLAAAVTLPLALWVSSRFVAPIVRTIAGLSNGIRSFRDRDFSVRLARTGDDELGGLIRLYNEVGATLQEERAQIRQRELLLQTALNRSPSAIVLVNPLDRILYANREARGLFMGGDKLEGLLFADVLEACPPEMRRVLDRGTDGIFSVNEEEDRETYHLRPIRQAARTAPGARGPGRLDRGVP